MAAIVLWSPGTLAQTTVDQILSGVQGKSSHLAELATLFQNEDPAVRLHAFEVLSDSQDPDERRLAYEQALLSADPRLNEAAIFKKLTLVNPVVVTIYAQDGLTKNALNLLEGNERGFLALNLLSVDKATKRLVLSRSNQSSVASQVSADTLRLAVDGMISTATDCTGDLRLEEGRFLRGPVSCNQGYGTLPAEILLVE